MNQIAIALSKTPVFTQVVGAPFRENEATTREDAFRQAVAQLKRADLKPSAVAKWHRIGAEARPFVPRFDVEMLLNKQKQVARVKAYNEAVDNLCRLDVGAADDAALPMLLDRAIRLGREAFIPDNELRALAADFRR